MAHKDITNKKFGLLTAKYPTKPKDGEFNLCWFCECECGGFKEVRQGALNSGQTKSCGCLANGYLGHKELSMTLFNSYKYSAAHKNLPFNIDIEFCYDLYIKQDKKCALSGIDIALFKNRNGCLNTASLDRIDSNIGYIYSNIRWLHKDINIIKNNFSDSEFLEWCKKITEYQNTIKTI